MGCCQEAASACRSSIHRQTVLVADDEPMIRQIARALLSPRGYVVKEAGTAADVLRSVQASQPDVILLDLGLPDGDGIEVTQHLRRFTDTPIIIVSVRAAESDKIAALDSGADDYLTKPCPPEQLLERVSAALLRKTLLQTTVFVSGDLTVDLNSQIVHVRDRHVELSPIEFDLLKFLVRNAGKLLTQRRLAKEIWHDIGDGEALERLRTTISALRQKLEANPSRPRHIVTEQGVGYRLRIEPQRPHPA
jgi:two-component system, OmpR family, KDP operon response regulator KdpE